MIMMGDRKNSIGGAGAIPKKDEGEDESLRACCEEMMTCLEEKDIDGFMAAMKACFAEMESKPHEEGMHIR